MHSSTVEMVEKKVLEMAQHASFHQHVSYNLSTILHAFTAGKTDPGEIAEAFSRARGLEVITRVISGQPVARPPVISLCCGVARRVIDQFGTGVSESQAGGLAEALVARLALGISGDDAQTVECQVECARFMSSVAGRDPSLLLSGGAHGAVEGMLERLGGKNRPGRSGRRRPARPFGHVRTPSLRFAVGKPGFGPFWGKSDRRSIMRPCCEALERVSRTKEGRTVFEERGTGGILLATIREFPDALEEGSDAALASALKVVERIFINKSPEACALSLRARTEEEPSEAAHHLPTFSDYANCVETLLAVVEATPEAPGAAAATCLWWLSGASSVAPDRALGSILAAAVREVEGTVEKEKVEGEGEDEAAAQQTSEVWSWFPKGDAGKEEGVVPAPRPLEAARLLAALCLSRPGLQRLEAGVRRESPRAVEALVRLCGSKDARLARACFHIVERLARSRIGAQTFVDAGALTRATEAGVRFEAAEDVVAADDDEAYAIAAALGAVAALAEVAATSERPLVDTAFQLAVRCLGRLGEFSGRPAAAAAKAAMDVITFRLTRSDRPKGASVGRGGAIIPPALDVDSSLGENGRDGHTDQSVFRQESVNSTVDDEVDAPMEVLKDAGAILAAMKAHPTDARVQESGWRSLIAMDTGRGDVERFLTGTVDGQRSRRQMLRDCLERHGGNSMVAGQVADILEGLALQDDSDGDHSLTAPLSDAHVDESFGLANDAEDTDADANESAEETPVNGPSEGAGKIDSNDGERGSSSNGPPGTGEMVLQENSGTSHVEGSHETETCTAESDAARKAARPQRRLVGNEDVGGDPEVSASEGGTIVREDASVRREEAGVSEGQTLVPSEDGGALMDGGVVDDGSRELSPENIRVELSLAGRKALAGDDTDSDVPTDVGHPATGGGSTSPRRSNVARSLFVDTGRGEGVDGHGRGTKQHGRGENVAEEIASSISMPVAISEEEVKLNQSWTELERLHKDIRGRSQIIGGENAEMVAAMADPRVLRHEVGAALDETDRAEAKGAFAASSLAMVGALTAATGALACTQRENQRFLTMSRDLRATSTWTDISEAMQWTMDTLKGTVILFSPHTGHGLTKDLGLCKNMDSAAKLFKEAALQIKIVVVELAGEHEPNTVWRIAPGSFESLPDNRKVMMLRHLRSLVVAYDHLSEERRKELTTALEIIKNRAVLNRMGKCCIQAEALEERRREAKIAIAEERLRVGTRRPSATTQSAIKRTPPTSARAPTDPSLRGSPNGSDASSSPGATPYSSAPTTGASTPPTGNKSPSGNTNKGSPPLSGRRVSHIHPKPARSTDNHGNDGAGGSASSGIPRVRGIASQARRRDASAGSPAFSRSPVPRPARSKSPATRLTRSKSPVPRSRLLSGQPSALARGS